MPAASALPQPGAFTRRALFGARSWQAGGNRAASDSSIPGRQLAGKRQPAINQPRKNNAARFYGGIPASPRSRPPWKCPEGCPKAARICQTNSGKTGRQNATTARGRAFFGGESKCGLRAGLEQRVVVDEHGGRAAVLAGLGDVPRELHEVLPMRQRNDTNTGNRTSFFAKP